MVLSGVPVSCKQAAAFCFISIKVNTENGFNLNKKMLDIMIAKIIYEKNQNFTGKIPKCYIRNIINEWESGKNDTAESVGW